MHRSAMQQAENGNAARCKRQRSKVQTPTQQGANANAARCKGISKAMAAHASASVIP